MSIRLRAYGLGVRLETGMAILGISMILFMSLASPALAGVVPVPWKAQVNKLNAVANDLGEINRRLNDIYARVGVEPTPWQPWCNGVEGELNGMANQLNALYSRVNAVLSAPPDDQRVLDALRNVRDEAHGVVNIALTVPPDPWRDALDGVIFGAQSIVDLANPYLDGIGH